jgi:DUF4097 and DUF4098 domain-containing protein YvlB
MHRTFALTAAILSLCFAAGASARGIDIDKVNGSIAIESDQQAGNLETVNGSIRIDDGGSAEQTSTVNGSVKLGARASVESIETVNGGVELGAGARVNGAIETVNGSITLDKGADVSRRASNVNGRITLDAAHVGGGIETVSGDIEVGADSRIEGGILVDRQTGWFKWGNDRKPRVVIGPRAVVDGPLEFRREVDLFVSDSATIGAVTGATAHTFSGARP